MTTSGHPVELVELHRHAQLLARTLEPLTSMARKHSLHSLHSRRSRNSLCNAQFAAQELLDKVGHVVDCWNERATADTRGLVKMSMFWVRAQATALMTDIARIHSEVGAAEHHLQRELVNAARLVMEIKQGSQHVLAASRNDAQAQQCLAQSRPVVLPLSRMLVHRAVQLLPHQDRCLYRDIFTSELYDVAQGSRSRYRQIMHAARVLLRAPMLRRELRAPAPPVREPSR